MKKVSIYNIALERSTFIFNRTFKSSSILARNSSDTNKIPLENHYFSGKNETFLSDFPTLRGGDLSRKEDERDAKRDLNHLSLSHVCVMRCSVLHPRLTYIQNNITTCFPPRFSFFLKKEL